MLAAMVNTTANGNVFVLRFTAWQTCGRHIHRIILLLGPCVAQRTSLPTAGDSPEGM